MTNKLQWKCPECSEWNESSPCNCGNKFIYVSGGGGGGKYYSSTDVLNDMPKYKLGDKLIPKEATLGYAENVKSVSWPEQERDVAPMVKQMQILEKMITELQETTARLWEHKNYQIAENKKISRRVDEFEKEVEVLANAFMYRISKIEEAIKRTDDYLRDPF